MKTTKKVKRNNSSETKRKFSPYELNLIRKAEFDSDEVSKNIADDQPLEYYLGLAEFRQRLYKVNEHTLIPRVETEEIIDLAIKYLNIGRTWDKLINREKYYEELRFADVGTGSGAIGISFADELKKNNIHYKGYLSDISEKTLDVAIENAKNLGHPELQIFKSNLFDDYPKSFKFDVIFANLPYIPSNNISTLANSVKNYEPILALDGGKDGLELILKCIKQAHHHLKEYGMLIMEVDDSHTSIPKDKWISKNYLVHIHKDSFDRNRFWVLQRL